MQPTTRRFLFLSGLCLVLAGLLLWTVGCLGCSTQTALRPKSHQLVSPVAVTAVAATAVAPPDPHSILSPGAFQVFDGVLCKMDERTHNWVPRTGGFATETACVSVDSTGFITSAHFIREAK